MPQTRGDSQTDDGVVGTTELDSKAGVFGFSPKGTGVTGITQSSSRAGVFGSNDATNHAEGPSGGVGIFGLSHCPGGNGVKGESDKGSGSLGVTHSTGRSGLFGLNDAHGAIPKSQPHQPAGPFGVPMPIPLTPEVEADPLPGNGVWGHSTVDGGSGVVGSVEAGLKKSAGVTGIGDVAGRFFGDVEVTGDIKLTGADGAEDFDVANPAEAAPGTVMVLGASGCLSQCERPYDTRVAGIVSGAGSYRPGFVLDHQHDTANRRPLALFGKVYCKADADLAPISVGDLLTTAPTAGHAMKATDNTRAVGAIVGKALAPLESGRSLIPVLVTLQ